MHAVRRQLIEQFRILIVAAAAFATADSACAQIDLELRPALQTVEVGETVQLGLYAVSAESQTLAGVDVVLLWPPDLLQLEGNTNVGAVPLLFSAFPGADPYDLNISLDDGDALYVAFAQFGTPVTATPSGTLLTTFEFTAVADGVAQVTMPPTYINDSETVVLDGMVPNLDVTGELFDAVVMIVPPCPADIDDSGFVDVFDVLEVLSNWGACEGACPADVTNDTAVDVFDLLAVLKAWGPCPERS